MEIGRCPRCSTAYTASEIAGFGILRAREARAGGPRMEYTCQGCGRRIHLVPYGEGRYAPPGQPPPTFVPEAERRPPWLRERAAPRTTAAPPADARRPEDSPEAQPPPPLQPPPQVDLEDSPLGPEEALRLLGVPASAGRREIERAFRARSRTCHPDKVAHLDEEFQELAERKFKRLRQAYDLLLS